MLQWEGFSPDPVLTGQMFAESIKGIQSAGVMTSAKHYIANEQEHFRQRPESNDFGWNITEPNSANLDDVTMHELYLWPFAGKPLLPPMRVPLPSGAAACELPLDSWDAEPGIWNFRS